MCVTEEKDVCLNGTELEKLWDFFISFFKIIEQTVYILALPQGSVCFAKCNIPHCDEKKLSDGEGHPACCWMHILREFSGVW